MDVDRSDIQSFFFGTVYYSRRRKLFFFDTYINQTQKLFFCMGANAPGSSLRSFAHPPPIQPVDGCRGSSRSNAIPLPHLQVKKKKHASRVCGGIVLKNPLPPWNNWNTHFSCKRLFWNNWNTNFLCKRLFWNNWNKMFLLIKVYWYIM